MTAAATPMSVTLRRHQLAVLRPAARQGGSLVAPVVGLRQQVPTARAAPAAVMPVGAALPAVRRAVHGVLRVTVRADLRPIHAVLPTGPIIQAAIIQGDLLSVTRIPHREAIQPGAVEMRLRVLTGMHLIAVTVARLRGTTDPPLDGLSALRRRVPCVLARPVATVLM
jgi:hypothetical protein